MLAIAFVNPENSGVIVTLATIAITGMLVQLILFLFCLFKINFYYSGASHFQQFIFMAVNCFQQLFEMLQLELHQCLLELDQ